MEAKKGRQVLTCTGGAQDKIVISEIMQRFRPIAPKLVTGDSLSRDAIEDTPSFLGRNRRMKRKCVRVRNYKRNKTKKHSTTDLEKYLDCHHNCCSLRKNIVTLQLLPEKDDDRGTGSTVTACRDNSSTKIVSVGAGDNCTDRLASLTGGLSKEDDNNLTGGLILTGRTVESWVTVECVTGTWTGTSATDDGVAQLGRCKDGERVRLLETDTCPGFVSDGSNRVTWVNGAYRRMMGVSVGEDVRVRLVVKMDVRKEIMACMCESLYRTVTCSVRIQYESATWQKENNRPASVKMKMLTVPCDVWRMGFGWFAWRLDVEAALCLGRCTILIGT